MGKAVFFDLDGTLLKKDKTVAPSARRALEACRDRGIGLYVATARPPLLGRMLGWDDALLSLLDGGVYYNGGCVVAGAQKVYDALAGEVLVQIVQAALEHEGVNIALQLAGERHAFRYSLGASAYAAWGIEASEALELSQANGVEAVKLLLFHDNLIDSKSMLDAGLVAAVEAACCERAQFYLTDQGRCIQVMGHGVNKVKGIERIRAMRGLGLDEVAVFGDDANDVEMLGAYRLSIAMGNASDQVKGAARYVTGSHEGDGIYEGLCGILGWI